MRTGDVSGVAHSSAFQGVARAYAYAAHVLKSLVVRSKVAGFQVGDGLLLGLGSEGRGHVQASVFQCQPFGAAVGELDGGRVASRIHDPVVLEEEGVGIQAQVNAGVDVLEQHLCIALTAARPMRRVVSLKVVVDGDFRLRSNRCTYFSTKINEVAMAINLGSIQVTFRIGVQGRGFAVVTQVYPEAGTFHPHKTALDLGAVQHLLGPLAFVFDVGVAVGVLLLGKKPPTQETKHSGDQASHKVQNSENRHGAGFHICC